MKLLLPLAILITITWACTPTECCDFPEELSVISPVATFGNLNEGDLLKYRFFYGGNYYFDETTRCYTNDTLIIEVKEVISENELIVEEYLSPTSEIFEVFPDSNYMWNNPDEINTLNWSIQNNVLEITDVNDPTNFWSFSKLNYFNKPYPLENDALVDVTFNKWKPLPLDGNYCKEVEILERTYKDLHMHVENGPTAADGNGATFLYSNEHAFVRTFTQSAWTGAVQGWDIVE